MGGRQGSVVTALTMGWRENPRGSMGKSHIYCRTYPLMMCDDRSRAVVVGGRGGWEGRRRNNERNDKERGGQQRKGLFSVYGRLLLIDASRKDNTVCLIKSSVDSKLIRFRCTCIFLVEILAIGACSSPGAPYFMPILASCSMTEIHSTH